MASAIPVTLIAQERFSDPDPSSDGAAGDDTSSVSPDDLPFHAGAPAKGATTGDATSGTSSRSGSLFSAQTGRASASGSALVDQMLGAARLMGHDVTVPELPYDEIATDKPLRAAILSWIAVTGAQVAPEELAAELLRADALPIELQRDLALIVLSASKAHVLQVEALAQLSPAQQVWIRSHPEVAEDLALGIDTPDTAYLAALSAFVDMPKSIQASLLMLEAVEATRGSLSQEAAQRAIEAASTSPLDPATRDLLAFLVSSPSEMSDAQKVLYAARVVSVTSGVPLPERAADITFADAVNGLVAASGQVAPPEALALALDRADALPADLQLALAGVIDAEAKAIAAAHPARASPYAQTQAMMGVLLASADAMPVLEKYGLFWSEAPDALRVGQWDPAMRAGWAAEHAGLFLSTNGDLADLVRAGAYLHGAPLPASQPLPTRTLPEAVRLYALEGGVILTGEQMAELEKGAALVAPDVAQAGALLVTGLTESWRLQKVAFAQLTPAQRDELMRESLGIDQLYAKASLTPEETARLQRVVALSSRVDGAALARSELVAVEATMRAKELLTSYQVQGDATVVETGFLSLLKRLMPFGTARAQVPDTAVACGGGVVADHDWQDGNGAPGGMIQQGIVTTDCAHDVLLRIWDPLVVFAGSRPVTCDADECWQMSFGPVPEQNFELLTISGTGSAAHPPMRGTRAVFRNGCDAPESGANATFCPSLFLRREVVPTYGAARIFLDLGGSDTYQAPVAMTFPNMSAPVSIHLDLGGNDLYADPSGDFDSRDSLMRWVGDAYGHPTQGSALWGGVAILVDAQGVDSYKAPTRSQGFGRYGLGALLDLGTQDDLYGADAYSMGASGDTLNAGLGVLVDVGGNDRYSSASGMGFGLGGVLLDLAGRDTYVADRDPHGLPVVHLEVLPGGDLTTLDQRGDNHVWIDGPDTLNVGLGLDAEIATVSLTDSDSDSWTDFAEFVAGSDPKNSSSTVPSGPNDRAAALLINSDTDLYPDFIERALSSDPDNGASYPAGFPTGPTFYLPSLGPTVDQVTRPNDGITPTAGVVQPPARGSDKIVDIQLPVQQAGSLDKACARQYLNVTNPGSAGPAGGFQLIGNFFGGGQSINIDGTSIPIPAGSDQKNLADQDTATSTSGVDEAAGRGQPQGICLTTSFTMSGPGQGNLTLPDQNPNGDVTPGATNGADDGTDLTFRVPTGILAIGDLVDTNYTADYFVAIDLGGDDAFHGNAGGALLVAVTPQDPGTLQRTAFAAPSVVLNVDLSEVAPKGESAVGIDTRRRGNDLYVNATQDATHGAFFGVLVDNVGADTYEASNLSQGSVGGILLDLAGDDTYRAGVLAQGASLAGGSGTPHAAYPNDARPTSSDQVVRGNVPGLLLDLGDGKDSYSAGAHSQAFARSFYAAAPDTTKIENNAGPRALALLLDQGGDDLYVAKEKGIEGQAVAGYGGTAILLDQGGNDTYNAYGLLSQGATLSLTARTQDNTTSDRPDPATALLVDIGPTSTKKDIYRVSGVGSPYFDGRTATRHENLTLTRQETTTTTTQGSANARFFAEVALHLDATADGSDPAKLLIGVGGTGGSAALSTNPDGDFVVNLPTARLAIGGTGPTVYKRDYALVLDLGGANTYDYNAGGLVREIVAQSGDAPGAINTGTGSGGIRGSDTSNFGGERSRIALYPVSLLVDVGDSKGSTYRATGGFAQGAGLFGVGVLVDLGGNDLFQVSRETLPALPARWAQAPPVVDGTVGSVEWDGIPSVAIDATELRDERFTTPLALRVANDGQELFLAIEGKTSSADLFTLDRFVLDFNQGRRLTSYTFPTATSSQNVTGIDQLIVTWKSNRACEVDDRGIGWNTTRDIRPDWPGPERSVTVGCRMQDDGSFAIEIKKSIVRQDPVDPMDMAFDYDQAAGWVGDREFGFRLEFQERGAGTALENAQFAWPAGTVDVDGNASHRKNTDLADELAGWASVPLAQLGAPGVVEPRYRQPALSQGAALAGVGVLAMLGETRSDARLNATTLAQAYAAFNGLAVLADAGGHDDYEAVTFAQGAADAKGLALFIEADGDDNYTATTAATGYTFPGTAPNVGTAFFLDLAGDDHYRRKIDVPCPNGAPPATCTRALSAPGDSSAGNNAQWKQNNGLGADDEVLGLVRSNVQSLTLNQIFNSDERVELIVLEYNATSGGCGEAKTEDATTGKMNLSGKVCLQALVDTSSQSVTVNRARFGGLNVTGVDFVLGGYRVARAGEGKPVPGVPNLWNFSAVLDLAEVPDGVATLRATATFAVEPSTVGQDGAIRGQERRGVLLFQDPLDDNDLANPGIQRVFIDNPATTEVLAKPPFTGIAKASWSSGAFGQNQELRVEWRVSHDAQEDLYEAYHDWSIPPAFRNLPCEKDGTELCNVLPFYLYFRPSTAADVTSNQIATIEGEFRTTPAPDAAPVLRVESGDTSHWTQKSPKLTLPLEIHKNNSFHLALPGRTPLYPQGGEYTTTVRLYVLDPNGQTVTHEGKTWALAQGGNELGEVKFSVNRPGTTDGVVEALRTIPATRDALDDAADSLRLVGGSLDAENPLLGVLQTFNTTLCQGSPATPGNFQNTCKDWNGDWDVSNLRMCTGTQAGNQPMTVIGSGITPTLFRGSDPYLPLFPTLPPNNNPTVKNVFDTANGGINTVNGATIVPVNAALQGYPDGATPDLCQENSPRNTTEGLAPIGDSLGALTSEVGAAISGQACLLQPGVGECAGTVQSGYNWTDFYFDVNPVDPDGAGPIEVLDDRVVLPPGYQIKLDFNVSDPGVIGRTGTGVGPVGEQIEAALQVLFDAGVIPESLDIPIGGIPGVTVPGALAGTPVCPGRPGCQDAEVVRERPADNEVHIGLEENVSSQTQGSTAQGLRRVDKLNPIVSFFTSDGGEQQPRFEVRVPTKLAKFPQSMTRASVTIEAADGATVSTLRGLTPAEGDVEGSVTDASRFRPYPTERPDVTHVDATKLNVGTRYTQRTTTCDGAPASASLCREDSGAPLPDGLYTVRVSADDKLDDASRVTSATTSLVVDSTPPQTHISTPEFAGTAILVGGSRIPVTWTSVEEGSGLLGTAIWMHVGSADLGNASTWRPVGMPEMFPNSPASLSAASAVKLKTVLKEASDEYWFIAVGIDRAGNVEGSSRAADLSKALEQAFRAKLADCGEGADALTCRHVVVDQTRPTVGQLGIKGGKIVSREGSEFQFLRGGSPVEFFVCAGDRGGEISQVEIALDYIDVAEGRVETLLDPDGTLPDMTRAAEPCEDGSARFVHTSWGEVNDDKQRTPDGFWSASFDVYDRAANRVQVPVANIVLDSKAPTATPLAVVYPGDQSAVKPGDTVKVRLTATDEFGVDTAIAVDATKLSRSAPRVTRASDGALEATITVDREDIRNGVEEIVVIVRDLAGNEEAVRFYVPVNFRSFQYVPGTLQVTNVTHNSLVLRWETDDNTTAYVRSGTAPLSLGARTPTNATPTKKHAITVVGLQPSTRYFLKAVSTSTGGYNVESDVIEATTASALYLTPISPKEGDKVSGAVPVRFRGGVLDSDAFTTFTVEAQSAPDKPWSFVTTATRTGGNQTLTFNSSRYLDGNTYRLKITAESGKDRNSVVVGPFTSDNTLPVVTILAPLIATNDTTPRVQAEITDALSGLGDTPAALYIDGEQVASSLVFDRIEGGVRVTYDVPSALAPGEHAFELRAQDKAGNAALGNTWTVVIDGDAPAIKANPTRFTPGTAAAKLGGTMTLNLTIKDVSGVASVVADTSSISTQKELHLVKIVKTDTWTGTVNVAAADAASIKTITITALDLAGNLGVASVDVAVDNVAPQAQPATLVSATHTKAILALKASEPVLLAASATAGNAPAASAATRVAANDSQVTLEGLLPSRTYAYGIEVVDRAGNAITQTGTFDTLEDTQAPGAVGTLSVLDLLNGTLRLSWPAATDDVGVAFYRVLRSDDGATFRVVAEVQGTSFDDAGLPYEKPFVYKVAAVDHGSNEGLASASLRASATAVPRLSSGLVTPTIGTVTTPFRYVVTYLSPGGVAPTYVRVILDGVPQEMTLVSGEPATGATYEYTTTLAPHKRDEPHTYTFEASDGRYTVRFPDDGSAMRGPLVSADSVAGGAAGGFASFARQVPAPGVGLVVALALALALALRRKEGSQ